MLDFIECYSAGRGGIWELKPPSYVRSVNLATVSYLLAEHLATLEWSQEITAMLLEWLAFHETKQ